MVKLDIFKAAEGFYYDPSPQRTKPWFDRRIGKVTASKLDDFMAVSKSKDPKVRGKKLKKRFDYETELLYEREFGVSYNNYVSDAMLDGQMLEAFALSQLAKVKGVTIVPVGCWYNDKFVASPDGAVFPKGSNSADNDNMDGLAEAKVLRDGSFSELLTKGFTGSLNKHWKQMQGQLRASGLEYVWFVAINMNTKKIYITKVERDEEFIELLDLYLEEDLTTDAVELDTKNVFDFVDEAPEYKETGEFSF